MGKTGGNSRMKGQAEKEVMAKEKIKQSFLKEILYYRDEKGQLVENPSVTDISFNGTDAYVQDNEVGRYLVDSPQDPRIKKGMKPLNITAEDIANLGNTVQNVMGVQWNTSEPILDVELGELRTNFMNQQVSPYGETFALRVSRPRLAITDVSNLCDADTAQLLSVIMKTGMNLLISGQTGSGKTEFQKALIGYIPDMRKISLMEDTLDSHIKKIYPHKDINSWATSGELDSENYIGFPELIRSGLRNNPDWLMISEVRGGEAQDLLSAALTGHSIMTTLHATGADNIPSRLSNMVATGNSNINFEALQLDIVSVLNLGVHLHMKIDEETGRVSREIREIFEYTGYVKGTGIIGRPIFERKLDYDPDTNIYSEQIIKRRLSDRLLKRITNAREIHNIPAVFKDGEYDGD